LIRGKTSGQKISVSIIGSLDQNLFPPPPIAIIEAQLIRGFTGNRDLNPENGDVGAPCLKAKPKTNNYDRKNWLDVTPRRKSNLIFSFNNFQKKPPNFDD